VQLSGGMKQKVAIARALAVHPEVLLLDEPFASIDEMAREKLNEEVLRIRASIGMSIVYITHNIEEAVFLSDRIAVLSKKTGTLSDVVEINLPKNRDALVRVGADFFTETVKVRHLLKNA
jgi:NitT/TauT family transport system ATP-binding protein